MMVIESPRNSNNNNNTNTVSTNNNSSSTTTTDLSSASTTTTTNSIIGGAGVDHTSSSTSTSNSIGIIYPPAIAAKQQQPSVIVVVDPMMNASSTTAVTTVMTTSTGGNSSLAGTTSGGTTSLLRRKQQPQQQLQPKRIIGSGGGGWNTTTSPNYPSNDDTATTMDEESGSASTTTSNATTTTSNTRSLTVSTASSSSSSSALHNKKVSENNSTNTANNVPPTKNNSNNSTANTAPAGTTPTVAAMPKACPAGRWALLCAQNAIRMGARTQLSLCPPGPNRRSLQAALRHRTTKQQQQLQNMTSSSTTTNASSKAAAKAGTAPASRRGGSSSTNIAGTDFLGLDVLVGMDRLEEYEVQEEDYLINTNTFHVDSDEEASSGDEDPLVPVDSMYSEEPFNLDDETLYSTFSEPLYTPASMMVDGGHHGAGNNNNNNANNSTASGGGGGNGSSSSSRLPFNRRKLRYFDIVTAEETQVTRKYLSSSIRHSKQQAALARCRQQYNDNTDRRHRTTTAALTATTTTPGGDPPTSDDLVVAESSSFSVAHPLSDKILNSIAAFDPVMTPALAASLLLQSLSINPYESVEGMAACYEGIVAAGVALLDSPDPTQPVQTRPTRSAIMAALSPLLITTLEPPSGEVILLLAKLRRWCGTARYRRRFVQRIAPALIRPPGGAMWCLKHQNDMVAIVAAAELIFDAAFDVFRKGWYERGQWMLADSKRAETLSAAAKQLRSLSQEPSADSLAFLQHPQQRRGAARIKALDHHHHHHHGGSGSHDEPLAEWEVIAVDRQIRISIGGIFRTDWTRAATMVHEASIPRPVRHRTTSGGSRSRLSSQTTSATASTAIVGGSTAEMSPRGSSSANVTPRSPRASGFGKTLTTTTSPQGNNNDLTPYDSTSLFVGGVGVDRMQTPPPGPLGYTEQETSPSQLPGTLPLPKSPKSPTRSDLSPKRIIKDPSGALLSSGPTPLSPSASSIGSVELTAYNKQGNSSSSTIATGGGPSLSSGATGSAGGPAAHYRMLTSTAAERKRTVAACRALRAQIQRFEDAFIQLHGRPPKGASDRAPLATTYAQYREWKRAIRADAACRIQALFRGASCRWSLLRINNRAINRIISRRAGRSDTAADNNSYVNQISLPTEIGQPAGTSTTSNNAEGFRPALAPQWSTTTLRPPSSSNNVGSGGAPPGDRFASPGASSSRPNAGVSPSSSPTNLPDMSNMSFAELQARKRDLKQQLKQYDMIFVSRHGRMPVKSEKEPIRHLYECYNNLKNLITQMEQDGRHLLPSSSAAASAAAAGSATTTAAAASTPPLNAIQRTVSPPGSDGSDDSASPRVSPLQATRAKRKLPKPSTGVAPLPTSASNSSSTTAATAAGASTDLNALKSEKQTLHTMLRSFEKEFYRENQRQVSSFADIRPVASQYRRYKEIKRAIAALQQQQQHQHQGEN